LSRVFAAHGSCLVRIDADLLVTEVQGPWNLELVDIWAADALPAARQLAGRGRWASLGVVRGSMLSTPDAVARLGGLIQEMLALGDVRASAYAIGRDVEGRGIMESGFERLHRGLVPVRFFDDECSARAWLADLLAAPGSAG
jgi:hypothetical protein